MPDKLTAKIYKRKRNTCSLNYLFFPKNFSVANAKYQVQFISKKMQSASSFLFIQGIFLEIEKSEKHTGKILKQKEIWNTNTFPSRKRKSRTRNAYSPSVLQCVLQGVAFQKSCSVIHFSLTQAQAHERTRAGLNLRLLRERREFNWSHSHIYICL